MNKSKNKRIYVIEFINYSGPSEIEFMVCESLEEAKDKFKELMDMICTDIEKGKCFIEDLAYAEIVESRTNESVVISY